MRYFLSSRRANRFNYKLQVTSSRAITMSYFVTDAGVMKVLGGLKDIVRKAATKAVR
jgi:hypothetical protein